MMVIATVLTAAFTALMIFGVRVVARYMVVTFAIVWLGMIAWLIPMAVGSHGHFTSSLTRTRARPTTPSSATPTASASARRARSAGAPRCSG